MNLSIHATTLHLLARLSEVRQRLDREATPVADPNTHFVDAVDSMALVEFLAVLAEDYGVTVRAIEACVGQRFGTVAELAASLHTAGLGPAAEPERAAGKPDLPSPRRLGWLAATTARLPDAIQSAASVNVALHRPAGWLERHAGIEQWRIWATQDPLAAAAEAGRACLEQASLKVADVGALLVTSEAPPLLAGLAAALHHRLELARNVIALEIGGACTGFLTALWTAQQLLNHIDVVLVVAVEAHTRYLQLQPGPVGENAALFGDAAVAALLCREPRGRDAVPLAPVVLGRDGSGAGLLQLEPSGTGVELHMRRIKLASRAVEAMAQSVEDVIHGSGLALSEVFAVIAHGGNGRLPQLLARKLGLPADRVWSETPRTGNLGSASLPVAWASHQPRPTGPVIWTAVGAGLTWGAVVVGPP